MRPDLPRRHRAHSRASPARGTLPIVLSAATVAFLAAGAIISTPQDAEAADAHVGTVTSVRITDNSGAPLTQASAHRGVVVEASWAAPAHATPGDFFEIKWPEGMLLGVPRLDIHITDTAPGATDPIAICSVARAELRCVYTDYVLSHSESRGVLRYSAQLGGDTESITFSTSGEATFTWDIAVTTPEPWKLTPPKNLSKGGHTDTYSGNLYWQFDVNPNGFPGVQRIDLTDTYQSSLSLVPNSLRVRWWPSGETYHARVDLSTGTDYTLTEDPTNNAFSVSLFSHADRTEGAYVVSYNTDVPADAEEGAVFFNEVSGHGYTKKHEAEWTLAGGGSGIGHGYGTFEIVKRLDGTAAATAGASHEFSGDWSCELPNTRELVTGRWVVAGAGTATLTQTTTNARFPKLPVGSTCSATEQSPGAELAPAVISDAVTIADSRAILTVTNSLVPRGSFLITKRLVDTAGLAPQDLMFTGFYECVSSTGTTGRLPWSLTAGTTVSSDPIPLGSVCSVVESRPADVSGARWETPLVSPDVTIADGAPKSVTVTNTLTADPQEQSSSVPPKQRADPRTLPTTGGDSTRALWVGFAALLVLGAATLWAGSRSSTRNSLVD